MSLAIKSQSQLNEVVSLRMENGGSTTQQHLNHIPFPRNSVNVIVGPTHVGKTYFVTKLINNYKVYFTGPLQRILIILCNDRVQPIKFDSSLDVEVEQIPLSEFEIDTLSPNDLVVIDDLQIVTELVRSIISVCTHHCDLVSLFIITHGLVGSPNFELAKICHRLFFFTNASANAMQIKHIINHFYQDIKLRDYLKSAYNFCEYQKEIFVLESNPIVSSANLQVVLAFSHLTSLIDKGFFLLYPHPYWGQQYISNFTGSIKKEIAETMSQSLLADEHLEWPQPTLVAVPANVVLQAVKASHSVTKKEVKCLEKTQWEETNKEIEENIESYFPAMKWQRIKNLAKEILRNPNFCVKTDGKTFHLVNRPRTEVSMIDFLAVVTRRAGPMERERDPIWKLYSMHVDTLLKNNAPKDLFKNKLLLSAKYK